MFLYLFSSVLLILRIKGLHHFALINLPHRIHVCTNAQMFNIPVKTSLCLCGPPSAQKSPLSASACLSWANFDLFPCIKFSAALNQKQSAGNLFSTEAQAVSYCFSRSDYVSSRQTNRVDSCFRPHSVSEQVKLGSCAVLHRVRARAGAHTHINTHSVTVQNPCLGYLETGVDFLMHISESLFSRASSPLSANIGRLAPVTLTHMHKHSHEYTIWSSL